MAMPLYQKYIAREVMASVGLVLLALLALYGFFDLIAELREVGKGSYQLGHALLYVSLRMPGRIYELMPIAVLIGTLYALSTLARYSEITVLRASGVSTRKLLFTLFKVAGVFALLNLVIGEVVAPPSEQLAQEMRLRATQSLVAQEFRSGLWVKDGTTFINVRAATPDAQLEGVRIYQFDDQQQLLAVSEAERGEYLTTNLWHLEGVSRTLLAGDQARVEFVNGVKWASALTPDILSVIMVSPERMSLYKLVTYTKHLLDNHQKTDRYEIAIWKKFIYPAAALVMVALALPFAYTYSRVGGVSLKIFAGVMTGIVFHMLNGLFSHLGVINGWSPLISALAPSALFLLAAVGMMWWVERR